MVDLNWLSSFSNMMCRYIGEEGEEREEDRSRSGQEEKEGRSRSGQEQGRVGVCRSRMWARAM